MAKTVIEILNKSLNKVAEIRSPYPLNKQGMILRYSKELSDYGKCTFRVSSLDPVFGAYGDILKPHAYNVRIKRGGTTVWQGAIVNNTQRTKNFIEVEALEYLYYLDKMLIRRTSLNPGTGQADGLYRIFSSGTLAAAVSGLMGNAKTDFGSPHPLAALTVTAANIDNPNYPPGLQDATGANLAGAWSFTSNFTLQYDFQTVYYVLKQFGIYANCDFKIDESLTFYWRTFLGNKHNNIVFQYDEGSKGNIVDYNATRLGQRMVNDIWAVATDTTGQILHLEQGNSTSINTYGKLEGTNAYIDVKDKGLLKTRANQDLYFTATPDDSPVNILLDERAYPLGQYDIGDILTVKIKDNVIDYQQKRRIVGITVNLHDTGRELTTVQTNAPRESDLSA